MSLPGIPHLIYSTRAARPRQGSDLSRYVIAESPGLPHSIRTLFDRSADITLPVRERERPVVFVFRSVRAGLWLFLRAVSIGLLKDSRHQVLAHGLILRRAHLDALAGNLFLLDRIGGPGVFSNEHPDGRRRLREIELPENIAEVSYHANRVRFASLARMMRNHSEFHRLFDGIRQGQPVVHEVPWTSEDWVEWMILHFHPHDRAEIHFNTWAVGESGNDYALSLVPSSEPHGAAKQDLPEPSDLAVASERLRRDLGTESYTEVMDRYLLTYLSKRDAPPVTESDALLVLRHELGELLPEEQQELVAELELRRLRGPSRVARHLGDLWREEGFALFNRRFDLCRENHPEVGPEQLTELQGLIGEDIRSIWTGLELVRRKHSEKIDEGLIRDLWRALVPAQRYQEVLDLFEAPDAAERVREALSFYARTSVECHLSEGAETALADVPYWSAWEAWMTARFGSSVAILGQMEAWVAEHTPRPEVAAGRYRELFDLALRRGAPTFAYRLCLQRELPALAAVDLGSECERLEELIRGLAEGDPHELGEELRPRIQALRFFLTRPPRELLEEDADARTLLDVILRALVYSVRAGKPASASEVLQRLQPLEPSRFVELAGPDSGDDWLELLSQELLAADGPSRSAGSETWQWSFELCLRLAWWRWARAAPDQRLEDQLARLLGIGTQADAIPAELLQRVIHESVPAERQPDAWELADRLRGTD